MLVKMNIHSCSELLVFDIETIPDHSQEEFSEILERKAFPPHFLHRVVSIGYLVVKIGDCKIHKIKALNVLIENDEIKLLETFNTVVKNAKPRLISYNGKNFDLPVLKLRSVKYGISMPILYNQENRWETYWQRNSFCHLDLMEWFAAGYGTKFALNELAIFYGLPTKINDIKGGDVALLFERNLFKEIGEYCLGDVLITYLLYLIKLLHEGGIDLIYFVESLENILREENLPPGFAKKLDKFVELYRIKIRSN